MNKWLEMFEEDNGGLSSVRVIMMFWNLAVGLVWMILSIRAGVMQPLDGGILVALGIANSAKVVQKFTEAKKEDISSHDPEAPPPIMKP